MIRPRLWPFLAALPLMPLWGCELPAKLPEQPSVEFSRLRLVDTIDNEFLQNPVKKFQLQFRLVDGDGDVGLHEGPDTASLERRDLFVEMFERSGGVFERVELAVPMRYRMPYIQPVGQNKSVEALVQVEFEFAESILGLFEDTLMFHFQVSDLAGNLSNIDSTPAVAWRDTVSVYHRSSH